MAKPMRCRGLILLALPLVWRWQADAFAYMTARQPTEANIASLEKAWRAGAVNNKVTSIGQLDGTWSLASPKESAQKGFTSFDIPRMLLNLYAGDIGRMLSMELVAAPQLRIAGGKTVTETKLRWGSQEDDVTLQGQLEVVEPNTLREKPKLTRSRALKLTWPAMQQPRRMKITYFDGNLLILRDDQGVVDVWRREVPQPAPCAQPRPPSKPEGEREEKPMKQAQGLREEVQGMSKSLEALRNQSAEDHQARKQLAKEIQRLEKELDDATSSAQADSVILKALEKVNNKVSNLFEAQNKKTEEKARNYEVVNAEMQGLQRRVLDLEEKITRYRVREGTLQKEIKALYSEKAEGQAFRDAMQQAKRELKEVRHDLQAAMKEVARLREQARMRSFVVERAEKTAANEAKAREKLEEELLDQKRGRNEAQERLSAAARIEKDLRGDLAQLRNDFVELQEREARARSIAAAMEEEIDSLLREAKDAAHPDKKKRFWPFR